MNTTPPDPVPIDRRTAYRLCATVVKEQMTQIEKRARSARNPKPGRSDAAKQLFLVAGQLHALAQKATGTTTGVDAACLGYLLAYLAGSGLAKRELLAEMESLGLSHRLEGITWGDHLALCRAIVGEPEEGT